jgi:hypothetical protein
VVWLALVVATAVSWWLSTARQGAALPAWSAGTLLLLACLKAALIVRYFMEVARAPRALRLAFAGWLTALYVALLALALRALA